MIKCVTTARDYALKFSQICNDLMARKSNTTAKK
jgi:hypothetical protein